MSIKIVFTNSSSFSAAHDDSLEGAKMNRSSSSVSSCDLLAKSDVDINEVVQKFRKLDFEQKRLLLQALSRESSEDNNDETTPIISTASSLENMRFLKECSILYCDIIVYKRALGGSVEWVT